MGALLSFLWEYKTLIIIAFLSIALAGTTAYIRLLQKEKAADQQLIINLNDSLKISKSSIDRLQGSINEQNRMIEEFKQAAEKNLEEKKEKLKKAETDAGIIDKQASEILNKNQPKDSSACKAAIQLFDEEIRNAKK